VRRKSSGAIDLAHAGAADEADHPVTPVQERLAPDGAPQRRSGNRTSL
jgi:hypothetical protein